MSAPPANPLAYLGTPQQDVERLFDVKYLTLAGFTVLIYDIFLTMDEEILSVWKTRRLSIVKFLYLMNRYGTVAYTLFYVVALYPTKNYSARWCENASWAIMSTHIIIITMGNGLILYKLIRLWDCKTNMLFWLMAGGFTVFHVVSIIFAVITDVQLGGHITFVALSDTLRSCVNLINPPGFRWIYIPQAAFDVYAFSLLLINALHRPRSSAEFLLGVLYTDGLLFFVSTLSLRLLNLVINVTAPIALSILATIFGCALSSTAVSRLYLRLDPKLIQQSFDDDIESFQSGEGLVGYVRGDNRDRDSGTQSSLKMRPVLPHKL